MDNLERPMLGHILTDCFAKQSEDSLGQCSYRTTMNQRFKWSWKHLISHQGVLLIQDILKAF